jgi:hypothetical protein
LATRHKQVCFCCNGDHVGGSCGTGCLHDGIIGYDTVPFYNAPWVRDVSRGGVPPRVTLAAVVITLHLRRLTVVAGVRRLHYFLLVGKVSTRVTTYVAAPISIEDVTQILAVFTRGRGGVEHTVQHCALMLAYEAAVTVVNCTQILMVAALSRLTGV